MTRLLTTIAALTALGTASAQVPEAWKDWPPEVFDRVAPVTAGLQPGADGLDGIAPVDLQSAANDGGFDPQLPDGINIGERLMYARLRNGDLSEAVRAWLRRRSRDELTQLVATTPRRPDDHRVSDTLIEALLADAGKGPPVLADLPGTVRLRVADYYRDRRDDRCVPLYERLLEERQARSDTWVPELFGLGMHYLGTGRPSEAARLFSSVRDRTTNEDVIADYTIEALRALAAAGHPDSARQGYEQLLAQPLRPYRCWVAVDDLAGLVAELNSPSDAEKLRADARAGKWGKEVKVLALVGEGTALRERALAETAPAQRAELFGRALRSYEEALAQDLPAELTDPQVKRAATSARAFVTYLSRCLREGFQK